MRRFNFHLPDTIEEATALLSQYGDEAKLLSGGTALTVLLKHGLVAPDHLICLRNITGSSGIEVSDGVLRIGALTTQRAVETSPLTREYAPLLAEACRRVATVRIRNMATVGGGVAEADPSMDPPPSLLVLGASVKAASIRGERSIPAGEVWIGPLETSLESDEIITGIEVPVQHSDYSWIYTKFLPRSEDDYATVSVAAVGRTQDGVIADVRVGLGAAGPTPLRASALESALLGKEPTPKVLRDAADMIYDLVDPIEDTRGTAGYKRDMAVVFARRALEQVFGVRAPVTTANR